MKAITIWQPWATLIAIGAKRYETRSWSPRHIGPIAIHASVSRKGLDLCSGEPFRSVLARAGIRSAENLPFGCVVAIARLGGTDPVEGIRAKLSLQELSFGDFSDGRFAWLLENVLKIREPIKATGAQNFWDWDPPAGLLSDYLRSSATSSKRNTVQRPMADARDQ